MTAEVALISRRAVTLAADSAISIGNPGEDVKIFNSAEKIFELSVAQPVGLMIYNNIDLLRAPLEILARNFREKISATIYDTLEECADAFMQYLNDFAANEIGEDVKNAMITTRLVRQYKAEIADQVFDNFIAQPPPPAGGVRLTPQQIQSNLITDHLDYLRATPRIQSHAQDDWNDVANAHDVAIAEAINETNFIGQLSQAERDQLREIGARQLLASDLSGAETGLVIAGYGGTGIYPSLVAFEIDGFVIGKLRAVKTQDVKIEAGNQTVDIITFAQEDISKRLLDGIDPEIAENITRQLRGGLRTMRQAALQNVGAAERVQVESDYDAAGTKLYQGINSAVRQFVARCNGDFYSTVAAMPKQEMAFFAESLVNMTAMKRRVSKDREDVGGPVDVAVISRHEGFVWSKRKYYFDPERNPGFLARRYGKQ